MISEADWSFNFRSLVRNLLWVTRSRNHKYPFNMRDSFSDHLNIWDNDMSLKYSSNNRITKLTPLFLEIIGASIKTLPKTLR